MCVIKETVITRAKACCKCYQAVCQTQFALLGQNQYLLPICCPGVTLDLLVPFTRDEALLHGLPIETLPVHV